MSTMLDTSRTDARLDPLADAEDPSSRRGRGRAVAAALGLVCLASAALLAWVLAAGSAGGSAGSLTHADGREDVMSLGDQFVRRLGTYSPEMLDDSGRMPAYRDQVREVITPKFAADFDKEVATAEQLVAQGGITRTADVFATAVSSIDDDSARVLVAGAFTDSYARGEGAKAETVDQEPLPFRFTVDVVMIEGEWLVDDFTPVGNDNPADQPGEQQGGGQSD